MASPSKSTVTNVATVEKPEEKKCLTDSPSVYDINLDTNLLTIANPKHFPHILKETGNRLLLVEFFAEWCAPCMSLASKLEEIANAYNGKILVVKVNVDEFEDLTLEYNVSAIPTIMLMKNQTKLEQFSSSSVHTLETSLEKHVGKPADDETEKQKEPPKGKTKLKAIENKKKK